MTRPILIVRPEPGNSATAMRIKALELPYAQIPLFEILSCAWTPPDPANYDAIMVTSANALRYAGDAIKQYRDLPLYAVGPATAREAKATGFKSVYIGPGNAIGLIVQLKADGCTKVFHPCGLDRTAPKGGGAGIDQYVVYGSQEIPNPTGLKEILLQRPIILVHSARAGIRLAELVKYKNAISLVTISAAVAKTVGGGWASVDVAARPDDQALLAVAARLCKQG